MPLANVRGVNINYRVIGTSGPWVALAPGGRNALGVVESIGQRIADAGHRVLIHDRRNCGASDVSFDASQSEYEMWADDLHELLKQLDAAPAWVGGSSSGCRMALVFALRHPQATQGLLLWRVTGTEAAAQRLARRYYTDLIELAKKGGMAAVCESEHFHERIAERPENRGRLMSMDPKDFIAILSRWNELFMKGANLPVIGVGEAELRSINVPVCVVPGNDLNHPPEVGAAASRLMPRAKLHPLLATRHDAPQGPRSEWDAKEAELAALFVKFMRTAG